MNITFWTAKQFVISAHYKEKQQTIFGNIWHGAISSSLLIGIQSTCSVIQIFLPVICFTYMSPTQKCTVWRHQIILNRIFDNHLEYYRMMKWKHIEIFPITEKLFERHIIHLLTLNKITCMKYLYNGQLLFLVYTSSFVCIIFVDKFCYI